MRFTKFLLLLVCPLLFLFSCKKETENPYALPDTYSDQAIGKSAADMLSDATYTSLNIQIQYMPGYAFDSAALQALWAYLNGICNKPAGISITQVQIAQNSGSDTLNVSQVAVLEKQYRTAYTTGNTLAVYVMITDGYDTSGNVLGFAYRNTSICLFGKDIFEHSGGILEISRLTLETSILEHEFGHIMGLVNLGSAMQVPHQDTAHGNHCTNPHCLMYYAIDTHDAMASFTNAVPVLDSNCLADLRWNGGK
jgi:hypothetical protein